MSDAFVPKEPSDQPEAPTTYVLLNKARQGDSDALNSLFQRCVAPLRRWARGRMPMWARGIAETADLVQDAMFHAFKRLDRFEVRQKGALQAYLRQSIQNRIRDELRAFSRRPPADPLEVEHPDDQASPLELAIDDETRRRYLDALRKLRRVERELIVGRLELGYNYEQLAAATGRATPEAARIAVRRALARLAEEMGRV